MSTFEEIYLKSKELRQYYEPLLVEDIIAINHPLEAHYGKCSVIGKLLYDDEEKMYFLESLRVPALPQDLQLPDGFFRIRLITGLLYKNIPLNSTVEAIGEVVLWNCDVPHHDFENVLTKTSHDLHLEIQEYYKELASQIGLQENHITDYIKDMPVELRKNISDELRNMKNKYKVVLKPYHISRTSSACDIIGLNLEIKYLHSILKSEKLNI